MNSIQYEPIMYILALVQHRSLFYYHFTFKHYNIILSKTDEFKRSDCKV